jgi:hypothetical protein
VKVNAKQLSGEAFRPPAEERCPHHEQCRDELSRPQEMLCGYHSHKRWEQCFLFVLYEHQAKKAKDEAAKANKDCSLTEVDNGSTISP